MTNKFIKAAELPPDFDISRYDVCAQWNLGIWAANLAPRLLFDPVQEVVDANDEYANEMREAIELVFSNPVLTDEPYRGSEFPILRPTWRQRVRDETALEMLAGREYFGNPLFDKYTQCYLREAPTYFDETKRYSAEWISSRAALKQLRNTSAWRIVAECYGDTSPLGTTAYACVDLSAPDDTLVDDFKRWLAEAREGFGIEHISPSFAQPDLDGWASMRVLAYIDLSMWARTKKRKITDATMGRVLFPNEFDVDLAERVRRVVGRDARLLTNADAIRSMQSQFRKAEWKNQKLTPESDLGNATPR